MQITPPQAQQGASTVRSNENPAANPAVAEPIKLKAGFAGELEKAEVSAKGTVEGEAVAEHAEVVDLLLPLQTHLAEPVDLPVDVRRADQEHQSLLEAAERLLLNANAVMLPASELKSTDKNAAPPVDATAVKPERFNFKFDLLARTVAVNAGNVLPVDLKSQVVDATAQGLVITAGAFSAELDSATPLSSNTSTAGVPSTAQALQTRVPEQALKLQGPEAKWGEKMLHSLRNSVDLQVQQKLQTATIRLDPPELGSMEILIKHEAGHLSVQISASQTDVAKMLQQVSERLRHELVGQHFTEVSVEIGGEGTGDRQQSQQHQAQFFREEPVIAAQQVVAEQGKTGRSSDVLVTV